MLIGRLFKLNERTLGVEVIASERKMVTIPVGAMIEIVSVSLDGHQTVDVLWGNRKVELLTCDVKMRGTEITQRSAQA